MSRLVNPLTIFLVTALGTSSLAAFVAWNKYNSDVPVHEQAAIQINTIQTDFNQLQIPGETRKPDSLFPAIPHPNSGDSSGRDPRSRILLETFTITQTSDLQNARSVQTQSIIAPVQAVELPGLVSNSKKPVIPANITNPRAQGSSSVCNSQNLSLDVITQKLNLLKNPNHQLREADILCLVQQALAQKNLITSADITGTENTVTRNAFSSLMQCHDEISFNGDDQEPLAQMLIEYGGYFQSALNNVDPICFHSTSVLENSPGDDGTIPGSDAELEIPDITIQTENTITPDQTTTAVKSVSVIDAENDPTPIADRPVCLLPNNLVDEDIDRNLQLLKTNPHICITIEKVVEHGIPWTFHVFTNLQMIDGPVWGLPHDNEQSAFDSALYAILTYGGKFVSVEAAGKRIFRKQDPNRNFGISKTETVSCRNMRHKPSPLFTKAFLKYFNPRYPVLTLHNNTPGGGISAASSSRIMKGHMSPGADRSGLGSPDNAIIIAGQQPMKDSQWLANNIEIYHPQGINIIYEHIQSAQSDCSLSNHVVLTGNRNYYNVEARHGDTTSQIRMIDVLAQSYGFAKAPAPDWNASKSRNKLPGPTPIQPDTDGTIQDNVVMDLLMGGPALNKSGPTPIAGINSIPGRLLPLVPNKTMQTIIPLPNPKPADLKSTTLDTGNLLADDFTGTIGAAITSKNPGSSQPVQLAFFGRKNSSTACINPSDIRDRDVSRHSRSLKPGGDICLTTETITEHGRTWKFHIFTNTRRKGPVWGLPHDNEQSAFDTAMYAIRKYGGKFVSIESGENRIYKGQDPNRNFGLSRSETASCGNMRSKPSPLFTRAFMKHFNTRYPVLTLHNNTNGGGISAARSTRVMKGMLSPVRGKTSLGDPDNAILFAGRKSYTNSTTAKRTTKYFHANGINVIYEHIRSGKSDCSLSNHVILTSGRKYFNVEAQHGHGKSQAKIVDTLIKFLKNNNG